MSYRTYFLTLAAFAVVCLLLLVGEENHNDSLEHQLYCERVAAYEATKNTNHVLGHKDWQNRCGE